VPFIFLAGKDVPKPPPTPSITTPASVSQDMSMNILMTTCIRAPPSPNAKVIVGELARYMTERNFQVGWLPNNPGIAMADHLPLSHPLIMWSQAGFSAGSANILQLTLFPSGDTFGVIPVEFPGAADGDKPTVMLHGAWRGRNGQGCVAIKMNDSEGRGIVYPYPMMNLSQAMFLRPATGPASPELAAAARDAKDHVAGECPKSTTLAARLACLTKASAEKEDAGEAIPEGESVKTRP
jgi:hypothetical protein